MHYLLQCECDCNAAYRLSVVFSSVQTARIKRGCNPRGQTVWLRMNLPELCCHVVDRVRWQRVCDGGDHADGRPGEATEAGQVPRGFREQRSHPQGDVQGWGTFRLPGFRLHQQLGRWPGQHALHQRRPAGTPVRLPGLWAWWGRVWARWPAHVRRGYQGLDLHHKKSEHPQQKRDSERGETQSERGSDPVWEPPQFYQCKYAPCSCFISFLHHLHDEWTSVVLLKSSYSWQLHVSARWHESWQ